MLKRHRRGEADDRGLVAGDREALLNLRLELRQVVAGLAGPFVEGIMLAAVNRLLRREGLDLLGELGRRAFAERTDTLDEESLPCRKGRRQRIVDCSRFDARAVPQPWRGSFAAEATV